jgi:hypothetical protein
MSRFAALGIPTEAVPTWLTLCEALDRLADEKRTPVCAQEPDQWGADATPAARKDAAEACKWCPVVDPCGNFGQFEKHGVWGGVDRGERRPRKAAA